MVVNGCTLLDMVGQGCKWLYRVVNCCTLLYIAVHSCTRLYQNVNCCIRMYTVAQGCTLYIIVKVCKTVVQVVYGCTGFYTVVLCNVQACKWLYMEVHGLHCWTRLFVAVNGFTRLYKNVNCCIRFFNIVHG